MKKICMCDVFYLRKMFHPRAIYLDKNVLYALQLFPSCLISIMWLGMSSAERKKKLIKFKIFKAQLFFKGPPSSKS